MQTQCFRISKRQYFYHFTRLIIVYNVDFFIPFLEQNTQLKTLCIGTDQIYQHDYFFNRIFNILRNLDGLKIHLVSEAHLLSSVNINILMHLNVESITVNGWCPSFLQHVQRFIHNCNWERVKFFESGNGDPDIVIPIVRAKSLEKIRIGLNHNITPKLIRDIADARNAAVIGKNAPLKICFHVDVSKKPNKTIRRI